MQRADISKGTNIKLVATVQNIDLGCSRPSKSDSPRALKI